MTAFIVVGVIAVVGAVVARVTWRRPADERHSIQSHQQTLDTLRAMADRRPGGLHDRSLGPAADSGSDTPVRAARTRAGSVRAPAPTSDGRDQLVFVDDAKAPPSPRTDPSARPSAPAFAKGLPRSPRGHRPRVAPGGRARTRPLPLATAVVVLGVVVGVAVAFAPSHGATAQHRPSGPATRSSHAKHPRTPVTVPPELRPTTATSSTAVYSAPSTAYTVALRATQPCWVYATVASTGKVVWTGTLTSGQSQSIPATGSLTIRFGAVTNVVVTLNGEQVLLPAAFQSPFDMTFSST